MKEGIVIKEYITPFSDPLKVKKGEILELTDKKSEWSGWIWCINKEGKRGWVPENYISISKNTCMMLCDYDATELTAKNNNKLVIIKEVSEWYWCKNEKGVHGWIPKENVKLFKYD